MARVFALHYDRMHHRASDTIFEPVRVLNEDGKPVVRGLAITSDDVAREHFATNKDAFRVEYSDTPEAERASVQAAGTLLPIPTPVPVAEEQPKATRTRTRPVVNGPTA